MRVARLTLVHASIPQLDVSNGQNVVLGRERVAVTIGWSQHGVVEGRRIDKPLVSDTRQARCVAAELRIASGVHERIVDRYREARCGCKHYNTLLTIYSGLSKNHEFSFSNWQRQLQSNAEASLSK